MSEYYRLDENKNPIPCTLLEWIELCGTEEGQKLKRVGQDDVGDKFISTVFLGMDHNFGEGTPLLFETMVFDDLNFMREIYMDRYSTWNEAIEGHAKAVQWVKDGCKDE